MLWVFVQFPGLTYSIHPAHPNIVILCSWFRYVTLVEILDVQYLFAFRGHLFSQRAFVPGHQWQSHFYAFTVLVPHLERAGTANPALRSNALTDRLVDKAKCTNDFRNINRE